MLSEDYGTITGKYNKISTDADDNRVKLCSSKNDKLRNDVSHLIKLSTIISTSTIL